MPRSCGSNAVSQPLAGGTDPETGFTFPDLNASPGGELYRTNLILPEPCEFLSPKFPACSVIRPSLAARERIHGELRSPSGLRTCATDRKSTRLNSSHLGISYAVFCL